MELMETIFGFLNDQVLKMTWLSELIKKFVENVFGLSVDERLGGSIQFFIYDTIKIFILLSVLIFIISYIQSYFPPERTRKILGKIKDIKGNVLGALLGTTFSFLISSPLVDLASFLLLVSFFGIKIAGAYVIVGLILAVVGGTIIDKLNLESEIEGYVKEMENVDAEVIELTRDERISYSRDQVLQIIRRVWLYIFIGVGIGAAIHNWIPEDVIQNIIGDNNSFSVIIASVVGIPMYADIFGTLPVAEALLKHHL